MSAENTSWIERSKRPISFENDQHDVPLQVKLGSMQRTADALERIATSTEVLTADYRKLEKDRDLYQKWWQQEQKISAYKGRQLRGVKAHNTRLKARIKELEQQLQSKAPQHA